VERAVELSSVRRAFGAHRAADELTFFAPTGRITALLGPNGAGKTTAIRLITGALQVDAGSITTLGLDPAVHGETVRRRCGVVSAKPALYDRLSGLDNLRYSASLHGMDDRSSSTATTIVAAAERFGIEHALDQKVGGYSTGMKTRLALARSILHDPDLLLYDEPTSGLDPESSAAVLGLIRQMTDGGRTVVLCTHLLAEAEGLADHVVMMEAGRVRTEGAPGDLTRRIWPEPLVRLRGAGLGRVGDLAGVQRVVSATDTDAEVVLHSMEHTADVVAALVDLGARIAAVTPFEPTLEDLYFAMRGAGEDRR
jgi:ABC-2 type transport system ATP-binding protein